MLATLPTIDEAKPDDWVALCLVCDSAFVVRSDDAPADGPAPHGSFCPDCRENKKIAPGVLNWSKRKT